MAAVASLAASLPGPWGLANEGLHLFARGVILAALGSGSTVEKSSWGNSMTARTFALILGIVLTVVGSCGMALGNVVMKVGIHNEAKRSTTNSAEVNPFFSPVWWLGFSGYTVGAILHAAALAFAPASVLAPMNSLGLVANAIAASTVLGESFGVDEAVGTVGTVAGVTLCAAASFLPHDDSLTTSGIESWQDPWYLCYVGVCAVLTVGLLIAVNAEESRAMDRKWDNYFDRHVIQGHIELSSSNAYPLPMGGSRRGLTEGERLLANGNRTDGGGPGDAMNELFAPTFPAQLGMMYGVLAGLVGAQCVLEIKEFSACVALGVAGQPVWLLPQTYASAILCVASILLQIHFLNFGLARGEATLVVPTYYVFWTIFGTLGGYAKFQEFRGFEVAQVILFLAGLLVVLFCIGFMAVREMEKMSKSMEHTVAVLTAGELLVGEELATTNALKIGVPLAFGYNIIPVGNLSGRLKAPLAPRLRHDGLRRVRSHQELVSRRHEDLTTLAAQGPVLPVRGVETTNAMTGDMNPYLTEGGRQGGAERSNQQYYWTVGEGYGLSALGLDMRGGGTIGSVGSNPRPYMPPRPTVPARGSQAEGPFAGGQQADPLRNHLERSSSAEQQFYSRGLSVGSSSQPGRAPGVYRSLSSRDGDAATAAGGVNHEVGPLQQTPVGGWGGGRRAQQQRHRGLQEIVFPDVPEETQFVRVGDTTGNGEQGRRERSF